MLASVHRAVRLAVCLTALSAASAGGAAAATPVTVYPFPGSSFEEPDTQIAFRGVPADQIGTVTAVGSKSGAHSGRIEADSAGQGASFLPAAQFKAGETVTVTTQLTLVGAKSGSFTFRIARPAPPITARPLPLAPAGRNGIQHFQSRPDLTPAAVTVTRNRTPSSLGDIFLAPQFGPTQDGPMILDPSGRLVWFDPSTVKNRQLFTDFRVQRLYGKPVLTWWQGTTNTGSGRGEGIIYSQDYRPQAVVKATDGMAMDLHEFLVTSQGQAYFLAVEPVRLPGHARSVADGVVQEVDIKTGLVLFEWNAMDHVPLSESSQFNPKVPGHLLDPYHLNSVSLDRDGNLIVSARNTSAVYKIDRSSGALIWTLGGKRSTFRLGKGTGTAFQHDAIVQRDGSVTIFDDGAGPPRVHPHSRGIRVGLDMSRRTATLEHQYNHSPQISAAFEGSLQALPGGDEFLGWGQQPYFSETDATGHQDFDAHFNTPTASYRAYRFPWSAQPTTAPAIAVRARSDGGASVYASWNGATGVAGWRVLAGGGGSPLTPTGGAARNGFETDIAASTGDPDFAVEALGAHGNVLATSRTVGAPRRIGIFARSAFLSSSAFSGVPAGCFAPKPCRIVTTVRSGRAVLARTAPETIGANSSSVLFFQLSQQGSRLLARARNHRLAVTLTARDTVSHATAFMRMTLVPFRTSGPGPKRTSSHHGPLALLGTTDFVSDQGFGGILTSCASQTPCPARLRLSVGSTVIARTSSEFEGGNQASYFSFQLTAAGRRMLAHAPGNQLATNVSLTGAGFSAGGTVVLIGFH